MNQQTVLPAPKGNGSLITSRKCRECERVLSSDNFVLRDSEVPFFGAQFAKHVCYPCRLRIKKYYDDDEDESAAETQRAIALRQILTKLRGEDLSDAPHITETADAMFKELGGLGKVAKDFKLTYQRVMSSANLRLQLDTHKALINLSEKSTEHRGSAPDLNDLSDEELAAVIRHEMSRMTGSPYHAISQADENA